MSHTPGPWNILKFDDEEKECICNEDGDIRIATIEHLATLESPYPDDAHLIAAAPELLEALIGAEEVLGDYEAELNEPKGALRQRIQHLIAKAKGE